MIPTASERMVRKANPRSESKAARLLGTSRREGEKEIMQAIYGPMCATLCRVFRRSPGQAFAFCSGLVAVAERELPKYLFFGLAASLVAIVALSVHPQAALAQAAPGGGGGGDAIQQTLENVRNYLAALSFSVGGIGFVASLLVKGYASINENAHAYAAMGMKGSLWCIVAGAIVTPILSIASGLAGG